MLATGWGGDFFFGGEEKFPRHTISKLHVFDQIVFFKYRNFQTKGALLMLI
jgi:hypothetical protein